MAPVGWLIAPPTSNSSVTKVAESFALAISNLQSVLTDLRLQAGYKLDESYDEHPCMQWTDILYDYPDTFDEFLELFDMLEATLEELPDYVEEKKLMPVSDIRSDRTKRLQRLVRAGRRISLKDLP